VTDEQSLERQAELLVMSSLIELMWEQPFELTAGNSAEYFARVQARAATAAPAGPPELRARYLALLEEKVRVLQGVSPSAPLPAAPPDDDSAPAQWPMPVGN
jgi:hypothetical protein